MVALAIHVTGRPVSFEVPLTGFQCNHAGFRFTLLETDPVKRAHIFRTLRQSIDTYCAS